VLASTMGEIEAIAVRRHRARVGELAALGTVDE
jgi:hypothetical protein